MSCSATRPTSKRESSRSATPTSQSTTSVFSLKSTIIRVLLLYSRINRAERRYEPRCYQFVVFECVRKLALTGLLIFIYPESASQIAIGLFIAVLAQQVFAQCRPYVEDTDDSLANVGNTQIILVFIASLMLFIKDMDEQAGAPGDMFKGPIFSGCMVLIGTLVLCSLNSLLRTPGQPRRRLAAIFCGNASELHQ